MRIICTKFRTLIGITTLSIFAIILAATITITSAGSLYFGYAKRLVPIYSVDTTEKKVALTFDAAWGSDKTSKIVSTLKEAGVEGTFFLVGFWIEQNEDKVKEIDADRKSVV